MGVCGGGGEDGLEGTLGCHAGALCRARKVPPPLAQACIITCMLAIPQAPGAPAPASAAASCFPASASASASSSALLSAPGRRRGQRAPVEASGGGEAYY